MICEANPGQVFSQPYIKHLFTKPHFEYNRLKRSTRLVVYG